MHTLMQLQKSVNKPIVYEKISANDIQEVGKAITYVLGTCYSFGMLFELWARRR